jgi:hypothetical protein
MIPWWKRLIYSLVSVVVGAGIGGAVMTANEFITNAHGHISALGLTVAVLGFDCWVVAFSLPGWVLAIPFVLLVKNIEGWRFWMYWVIGSCFGPALMVAVGLNNGLRSTNFELFFQNAMTMMRLAIPISCLTTLLYLLLLRRAQKRAAFTADVAAV